MGKTSLATVLNRHAVLGIDSMVFIYHIEQHPIFHGLTDILFQRIEAGKNRAISATLSLLEVLLLSAYL